eukprot:jgi/Tetstr1/437744/TSEL_026398.t1
MARLAFALLFLAAALIVAPARATAAPPACVEGEACEATQGRSLWRSDDNREAARLQRVEDEAAIKQFMREALLSPSLELSAEEANNYLHDLAAPSYVDWVRDESTHGWSIWAEDASLKDRVEVVVQSFLQGRRRHAKLKSVLAAKEV